MGKQGPIGSGFGPETTAEEALAGADLAGKEVIVTGGGSGIGMEAARVLAGAGAHVVVAARAPDRARQALAGTKGDHGYAAVARRSRL
jgi:NAD(P)-dependent dehydrogenase (short-subunit alcohol dehydrogenase family)